MASGGTRSQMDSFQTTGIAIDRLVYGFRPRKVTVQSTNGAMFFWQDTMPAGSAFKTLANGTRTYVTSNGITQQENGFTLGADAQVNAAGQTVHVVAEET